MSKPDIVTRLRKFARDFSFTDTHSDFSLTEAADEIERLRKEAFHLAANQCHAGYGGEYGHHRCREIDRLAAERDEARRRLCVELLEVEGHPIGWGGLRGAEGIAQRLGWGCFQEDNP